MNRDDYGLDEVRDLISPEKALAWERYLGARRNEKKPIRSFAVRHKPSPSDMPDALDSIMREAARTGVYLVAAFAALMLIIWILP